MPLLATTGVAVIAHRGSRHVRPENTFAAFDHALSLGVQGFECDVRLSSDGVPVVIHDATLDRTTNAAGSVAAKTADELARFDAGWRFGRGEGFPFRGRGCGVPRLVELLDRYPTIPAILEIKGGRPESAARTVEAVRATRAEDRVIIAGFSDIVIQTVRRLAPDIPTSASRAEGRSAIRRAYLRLRPKPSTYRAFLIPFRQAGRRRFNRRFVRVATAAGIPVHAWTINDPADMRLLAAWGVNGLVTDRPDVAMRETGDLGNWRTGELGTGQP